MTKTKRIVSTLALGLIGSAGVFAGSALVKDVQFARAEQAVSDARQQLTTASDLASVFKTVGKSMEQSVVHIEVRKTAAALPNVPPRFHRFMPEEDMVERATGSGVIMEAAGGTGFIVTNNHVAGDSSEIVVTLADGRRITDCQVVGADPKSDLALVKIKADRLIPAKWGDSGKLEKGDLICAFGSPFGLVGSMSHGIVSALDRQAGVIESPFAYENFIQVDAPINPGNSGGPLVNLQGEVVGINTAIASQSGGFQGIGFAIPSNQAKVIIDSLEKNGKVVRGYLGVSISDLSIAPEDPVTKTLLEDSGFKGDKGVLVREVTPDAPAKGVLKPGDIVTALDDKPLSNMSDFRSRVAATAPGTELKLAIYRDKQETTVTVKIGEQPEKMQLASTDRRSIPGTPRGQIGLTLIDPSEDDLKDAGLEKDAKGALIREVADGSPADKAGLHVGDVITSVNGKNITNSNEAIAALRAGNVNRGIRLTIKNQEGEKLIVIQNNAK